MENKEAKPVDVSKTQQEISSKDELRREVPKTDLSSNLATSKTDSSSIQHAKNTVKQPSTPAKASPNPAITPNSNRTVQSVTPEVSKNIVFVELPPVTRSGKQSRRFFISFLLMLIPAILGFLYFQFMASPMYISTASFAIRSSDSSSVAKLDISSMFLNGSGGVGNDSYIINEYIQSLDLAQDIDKELGIIKHFSDHRRDIISRLWDDPTQDELVKYWRWAVNPALNSDTGIITLEVRSYSPEMAQRLNIAIMSRSESLVNKMNERAQNDAVKLAQQEVKRAEDRVREAQTAMRSFRDRHNLIDPKLTAAGLENLISSLEAQATSLRTKIAEVSSYMRKDSPELVMLKQRLSAIEKQLVEEKNRVAGNQAENANLNAIVAEYEDLTLEAEFAQRQLVSAMNALEQSRIQQLAQTRYLVAYQKPTLPDESLYPRPYLFSLYIYISTILLVGLLSLIIAAVREHAGF